MSLTLLYRQNLSASRSLAADAATYTLTGSGASFQIALPLATATYAVSGTTSFNLAEPAVTGSYLVSGNVSFSVAAPASSGVYAITGAGSGFAVTLSGDVAAYGVAGSGNFAVALPAQSGAYVVTAIDATFAVALSADPASFAISGNTSFVVSGSHSLAADAGSFVISGAADLSASSQVATPRSSGGRVRYRPAPKPIVRPRPELTHVTLTAGAARFAVTTAGASLLVDASLGLRAGAYFIAPLDASLSVNRKMSGTGEALKAEGSADFHVKTFDWVSYDNEFLIAA